MTPGTERWPLGSGWFLWERTSFIFFWPFIVFAFVVIVTGATSYLVIESVVRRNLLEDTLPLTGDNIYSQVQRDLIPPVSIASLMAHDTFLKDWILGGEKDTTAVNRYLKEIKERYRAITAFVISDRSLNYYYAKGVLTRVSVDNPLDRWYFKTRKISSPYAINVDVDTGNSGMMTIYVNHLVRDYEGRFIGITGIGVTVDAMRKVLDHYQETFRRRVYFVDRHGTVVLSGTDGLALGSSIRSAPGLAAIADEVLSGTATPSPLEYSADRATTFLNSRFIPELGWFLLVEQNEGREVRRVLLDLASNTYVVVAGIFLALFFLYVRLRRRAGEGVRTAPGADSLMSVRKPVRSSAFEDLAGRLTTSDKPVSLILAAVDGLKDYERDQGVDAAQELVVEFRRRVAALLRQGDSVQAWHGGCVLMMEGVNLECAVSIFSRLIREFQDTLIMTGTSEGFTASFGVGCFYGTESPVEFLAHVDLALHRAMNAGGNRVETTCL